MKFTKTIAIFLISIFVLSACQEDRDDNINNINSLADQEAIKNFIWKAMNIYYVYKSDSPDLADDRFANGGYEDFLESYETPPALFYDLLADQDRFSVIVDDFIELENSLEGISLQNGMKFGLVQIEGSNEVFGYVRYVVPGSPADEAGLERGDIFNRLNGQVFNADLNFTSLFEPDSYTIGLAEFNGSEITELDSEITLNKIQITENPIHTYSVIETNNLKVGYLMYNNFRSSFDDELNAVFAEFQAENIDELVLDLRYNGGGSIESAKDLSSMITGQFQGEVFAKQLFNDNFDDQDLLFDGSLRSGGSITSLNLNQVYILTGTSTASASELVINALDPYINVIQIGRTTVGKFEGSTTLYDSPDFTRNDVNLEHTYALQPLILKTANKNGVTDFFEGLSPDFEQFEDFENLGVLGSPDETLLNRALLEMGAELGRPAPSTAPRYKLLAEDNMQNPTYQRMYVDDIQK